MVWVQVFPTGTTLISQSVQQFQDNWLFLQTNVNTDHFFNTGAPNEGHHRFVQMLNGGGDAALAAGMSGVVYTKNNGVPNALPWYRSANIISQVQTFLPTTYAFLASPNAIDLTVVNPTGGQLPAFTGGLITITQIGSGGNMTAAIVNYVIGSTPTVIPIGHTGTFSNITATGANTLSFTATNAGNAAINYLMMQTL